MRFGNWGADGTVPGSPIRQERIGGARSAVRRTEHMDVRAKSCPRYQTNRPGDSKSHRVFLLPGDFKVTVNIFPWVSIN